MVPTPPNVIVFFTDQQRWDVSGLHGCPLGLMPNFDRMAHEGVHIETSITANPVCGPARAAFQTGMYPTANGSWRNGIPLRRDLPTLAQTFAQAGYETAYIGKWHLSDGLGPVPPEDRAGYEYWLASNVLELVSDAYDCIVFDGDGNEHQLPGYRVDALTDAAIRFVASPRHRPYFLFLSFIEPHHQNHRDDYPAPRGYADGLTGRWLPPDLAALQGTAPQHFPGYCGMVKRLDEAMGRLRDALISLRQLEDTIFLFTSDHACHFKTRNGEYKRACEDSAVRVPTALYGGPFTGGGQVTAPINLVDLPPTLLDACGLTVPETMQGRSILPLVRDSRSPWATETFVQISESQVGRALRTKRWKYAVQAPGVDGWQVAFSDTYRETHLYDLYADPYELNNLAHHESHAPLRAQFAQRLVAWVERIEGRKVVVEAAEGRVPTGQWRIDDPEFEADSG